ncbi:hypothetical protein GCM10010182_66860 [Actinomadura cremea]|nr:hypothetical protein GCM10010182_66860 [Actinomadura cremea]
MTAAPEPGEPTQRDEFAAPEPVLPETVDPPVPNVLEPPAPVPATVVPELDEVEPAPIETAEPDLVDAVEPGVPETPEPPDVDQPLLPEPHEESERPGPPRL